MKITKKQLKQIINEELDATLFEVELAPAMYKALKAKGQLPAGASVKPTQATQATQAPDEQAPPKEPKIVDVNRMMQYIDKIDTPQEYQALLSKVVAHAKNVPRSKIILVQLARNMTALIKDL
jgi:hypothetical protein|tara:strand:+ start:261 stop:629 length:369 start_codon:yes stop_codon:yes gene_type:complete